MLRQQAFKFRIEPNSVQLRLLKRFAGMSRFIFNKALSIQLSEQELTGKKQSGYATLCKLLTEWRNGEETPWLAEGPSQSQQQVLKNLENGWSLHFKSLQKFKQGLIPKSEIVEKPTFKRKGMHDSFRFPEAKQFKLDEAGSRVFLPKLGWIRYRNSREILGTPKNLTVSLKAGHWYISIQTEREVEQPRHPSSSSAGMDMGIVRFATLWDGRHEVVIAPINSFKKHEKRLAKAQRQLSRKVKFSQNWLKAKARVQTIQSQIAAARNDFLHKTSHRFSQSHALLCVEDLQIRNMSRSASGTLETPGRNVKAKSGLNKAILDQGWGEFFRQLDYKLSWLGGWMVAVPPNNTSRTCPACGHAHADNRQSQSVFLCVACGHTENADAVAAKNILERGLNSLKGQDYGRIACEVNGAVRPSAAGTRRSEQMAHAL